MILFTLNTPKTKDVSHLLSKEINTISRRLLIKNQVSNLFGNLSLNKSTKLDLKIVMISLPEIWLQASISPIMISKLGSSHRWRLREEVSKAMDLST